MKTVSHKQSHSQGESIAKRWWPLLFVAVVAILCCYSV